MRKSEYITVCGTEDCCMVKVGDRVRVSKSVVIYHHPEHRNQAFDLQGQEGEVIDFANQWQDRPISANLPIVVKFTNKFKVHLQEAELEVLSET
ncbi:ferredoxin--nitrite reductase [Leptolyngbya sp. 'hensonii']|uniref:ferredoxin-thioredoxin reductase variable chain n=1 Tax=Leptolyngbya sp. 'hensonii' TaxID=1922337 RepID=UPI00094FD13F|nr:ferredoxin-thioredoxin reductase variable chain [Leptolyngbya sp. 'hensonii']OLP16439.1 ferredoxin--nitrite reductase [Leptolyngbya sp. 'hensonii']